MRTNFVSAAPDDSLLEADRIMRLARIRHLPVVEKGLLVGLLSHRDVLAASISRLEQLRRRRSGSSTCAGSRSSQVMQRDLYTGTESTTLGTRPAACCGSRSAACPWCARVPAAPSLIGI